MHAHSEISLAMIILLPFTTCAWVATAIGAFIVQKTVWYLCAAALTLLGFAQITTWMCIERVWRCNCHKTPEVAIEDGENIPDKYAPDIAI